MHDLNTIDRLNQLAVAPSEQDIRLRHYIRNNKWKDIEMQTHHRYTTRQPRKKHYKDTQSENTLSPITIRQPTHIYITGTTCATAERFQ